MIEKLLIDHIDFSIYSSNEIITSHTCCVYFTINLINQKFYIGASSNLKKVKEQKYKGSGKYISRAFAFHGFDNFLTVVIKTFDNMSDAYLLEKILITNEIIKSRKNYNLRSGGFGGWNCWLENGKLPKEMLERSRKTRLKNTANGKYSYKGGRWMWKDGVYTRQNNKMKIENLLSEGWIFKSFGFILSESSSEKRKKSMKLYNSKPETTIKRSETIKKWMSDKEKLNNMLASRYATNALIKEYRLKYFSNIEFISINSDFAEKMIKYLIVYSKPLATKRIQRQGWHYNIINGYRKIPHTNNSIIQLLIDYSKLFYELSVNMRTETSELNDLKNQLLKIHDNM